MPEQRSFTDRYSEMMTIAMLRHGILAERTYGSWDQSYAESDYAELGILPKKGAYGMKEYASLEHARCKKCSRKMKVIKLHEETVSDWCGTFADSEDYTYAAGSLVCTGEPDKHRSYDVVLNGTLGSAVQYLDAIADELGY